jgi:hypothetical protein
MKDVEAQVEEEACTRASFDGIACCLVVVCFFITMIGGVLLSAGVPLYKIVYGLVGFPLAMIVLILIILLWFGIMEVIYPHCIAKNTLKLPSGVRVIILCCTFFAVMLGGMMFFSRLFKI